MQHLPLFIALFSSMASCTLSTEPDPVGDDDPAAAPPVSCLASDPADLDAVATPGTITLGEFRIDVGAGGQLDVRHRAAPQRSVFASPETGAPLAIARAPLNVVEHQGSFDITSSPSIRCTSPQLDELRGAGSAALLRGRFADGGECETVAWELRLCEERGGDLAFRLSTSDPTFDQLTLHVASEADERIYGLGVQLAHDKLDLKGRTIPVITQEGGVGRGHTPISNLVDLASPGSGGNEAASYAPVAQYLTSKLRSVFLENTAYAEFDFEAPDRSEIRLSAPSMTGHILYGDTPLALIEAFTAYAGRMPSPPAWVNQGAIVALTGDLASTQRIIADLRSHGAAIAGVWNQTWTGKVRTYIGEQVLWNWVQAPSWKPFVTAMADDGIRTLCYVNPMFVDPPASAGPVTRNLYREALEQGYFVHDQAGQPYLMPATAFQVGLLDLTNPDARAWMKDIIKEEVMTDAGCSGWMVDFAEQLPFDAVLASGVDAATYHNPYPVDWMRLNREAIEEAGRLGDVITFNRSGSARTPAYSLMMWEGDQLTTWDKYDGLVSAMHGLLNGGFSGMALNHSDTGGYTSLSLWGIAGYSREVEQLKRWTEMNAFTAMLRTHEGNQPGANAQIYSSSDGAQHFARFTKVFRALAPYRAQLFEQAQAHGWPVVRHLWLHYPDDPQAQQTDDEFLLGSEILVAPIKNKCFTWPICPYDKEVYLPAGRWVHLWTGQGYGSTSGGTTITVKAPIGQPAVFYKQGSSVGADLVQRLRQEGLL